MKEPKIRFQESEGVWKNVYFSEIAERISVSGQAGTLPGIEFEDIISGEGRLNKDVYQKECFKYGKLFNKGDVLFCKLRPYLKNIILADFRGVAIGDFWVLRSKENNSKFLYTMVLSEAFMKVANISSGSKMPRADWNLVSATRFNIPINKKEQQYIGKYFSIFDTQISTASSRLASLKQVKEASLQAMFPQKGETVPKIRFKGFEGEWEEVKLKDISTKVIEKNRLNNISITLTNSAEYGIINQRDFFDHDVSNTDNVSGYFIVQPNDFVYNPRISTLAPVGPINMNKLGYAGVVSPLYYVFRVTGFNKSFLDIYFHTNVWHKFMKDNGNTGARFDRLSISNELFYEMPIYCPRDKNEQQQIASYFTSLDKQIALQTQRLEKLKQIKAACLDKMFV